MPRKQPLGLELVAQAGGGGITEGELIAEEGVFRAIEKVKLGETKCRQQGQGRKKPRQAAEGGCERRFIHERSDASQHGEADEAKHDQGGDDGQNALLKLGDAKGHQRPSGCRWAKMVRTRGSSCTWAQDWLLETRTNN